MTTWQHRHRELYEEKVAEERNRLAQSQLDRRMTRYRKRYPELDLELITDHGNTADYVAANPQTVQLIVVGAERFNRAGDVTDPAALGALVDAGCSLLTCDRQQRL